jgi:hypothetical protein
MKRLALLIAVAVLAAALGVSYAASVMREEPSSLPDPNARYVYLADSLGNPLRCAGAVVQVERRELGGGKPSLTPEQAVERMNGRSRLGAPSYTGFSCAKDAQGRETGAVAARVIDESGRETTRTIPAAAERG